MESVVDTPEVIFVQRGAAVVHVDDQTMALDAGDTFSVPVGACRVLAAGGDGAQVVVVQGN